MGARGRARWPAVVAALVAAALVAGGVVALVLVLSGPTRSPAPPPRRPPPLRRLGRPAPGLPAPPGIAFGASVNLLFNDAGAFTPGQIAGQLSALRSTGATFARSDALWEASEPRPPRHGVHHYDWRFDDTIAADLARAGLRWLPIIDYSAPWAQSVAGQDHSPPRSDADYAAYAQAFAARYAVGGTFWRSHPELAAQPVTAIELWNEPDNPAFWYPRPDAGAYATLYTLTREAIDAVDPHLRVLIGGLSNPERFLPALVAARSSLVGHVDGVAVHPYGTPAVVLRRVANARAALRALGMGAVPLYVTEFGWTTSPPDSGEYVPATRRPAYLRTVLRELGHSDCGVVLVALYTWASPERDPAAAGDWFGISPIGATADDASSDDGAAVAAFRAGLRAAAAPGPTVDACR